MFVFGFDIPLVEVILTLGVITVVILLEAIILLSLMIYYKKLHNVKTPSQKSFLKDKISKLFKK